MDLGGSLLFKIKDTSCEFRTINETDVSQEYIDGLNEQNEYIENIPASVSFSTQKKYIKEIINSKNNTICGLILENELVGTAGIQLSNADLCAQDSNNEINKLATIGIFIFSKNYRGKGLGKTLVWAATYLFHKKTKVEWFGAGMAKENIPSLKSFLSCGFKQVVKAEENHEVLLKFPELKKPNFIRKISIRETGWQSSDSN